MNMQRTSTSLNLNPRIPSPAVYRLIPTGNQNSLPGNEKMPQVIQKFMTGCQNLVAGYENLMTGCENLATGCQNLTAGCENLTAGCQNLVTGYENLTAGCEKPATGYEKVHDQTKRLMNPCEKTLLSQNQIDN